ncbi:MAG: polysaccharide biosynthesis/export family protein [Terriglobales bacterium]
MNRGVLMVLAAGVLALAAPAHAQNPLHALAHLVGNENSAAATPSAGARPPSTVPAAHYIIGPGDVLAIDVWHEKEISQTMPVRPDGDIALPLAGTLRASGLTPEELEKQIAARLAAYITAPVVTVMVTEVVSQSIQIMGAVLHPGSYPLLRPTHVLQALARAGGFTPFAHPGGITLLHWQPDGKQVRYRFDYAAVIHGKKLDEDRLLRPGDTLIVP